MSEQIWFIETSVSAPMLLPSLARASTVMERGNPKGTRAKVRCLPSFHQILDSRAAAYAIVLSQQPNTSFVLQKLVLYVANTKCFETVEK